jgi:hypothetical protein
MSTANPRGVAGASRLSQGASPRQAHSNSLNLPYKRACYGASLHQLYTIYSTCQPSLIRVRQQLNSHPLLPQYLCRYAALCNSLLSAPLLLCCFFLQAAATRRLGLCPSRQWAALQLQQT